MGLFAKSSAAAGAGMIVLSRNSFSLIMSPSRAFASTAAPDAVRADPEKSKRRKKKNLFEVAHFLPNWGLGYKLAKSHWRDVCYELTKINLYKDGRHGKAWGIRYKAGKPSSFFIERDNLQCVWIQQIKQWGQKMVHSVYFPSI
ncbi:putative mitochondrial 28S ribosomal protein S34 [Dioscorea sansibarensis]